VCGHLGKGLQPKISCRLGYSQPYGAQLISTYALAMVGDEDINHLDT